MIDRSRNFIGFPGDVPSHSDAPVLLTVEHGRQAFVFVCACGRTFDGCDLRCDIEHALMERHTATCSAQRHGDEVI